MFLLQKIFLKAKAAIGAAMILLMFTGGTASAKDKLLEAENLVLALITELKHTSSLAVGKDEDNRRVLEQLVDVYFDVDAITRFSVGRYWRVAQKLNSRIFSIISVSLAEWANEQFHKLRTLNSTDNTNTKGDKLILVGGIIHDKSGECLMSNLLRIVARPNMP